MRALIFGILICVFSGNAQTPLHDAAARCDVGAARRLVKEGANRSARDDAGRTPAMVALQCKDSAVLNELQRLLLVVPKARRSTDAPDMARWTLQGAAARGDADVADMLLKLGADANSLNAQGERALEVACRKGDPRVVAALLKRGADPKLSTGAGTTVLHEAALGGNPEIVDLLVAAGAAVDVPDKENAATPLHYAASFGRVEAVKALLRHGADRHRKDARGLDALQTAVKNGQQEVAEVLRPVSPK